ncbi:MAG: NAD(P)/FAD-dependent oxidoreductase [Nitrososphaerales archaeon]|nr:NAD(P)/FAD-dependent oxidoreductase [Nitrososphaerales archaeon]
MSADCDVLVMGGGLTGLITAKEVAKRGFKVKVLEEDVEIGLPEKCAGLVSMKALSQLGILPKARIVQNRIERAILHAPSGLSLEIDARKQRIVVLDRSELDKELAYRAVSFGAEILLKTRVSHFNELENLIQVKANGENYTGRLLVDARGHPPNPKDKGLLNAARFEVYSRSFQRDTVEIFFDQRLSPGFFTWIVPYDDHLAKVGTAGIGIDPFKSIESFLKNRKCAILGKVGSTLIVSGPSNHFVFNRVVRVGDAAGQTKPTTAGGIYTGGMGGILAGRALIEALDKDDTTRLKMYEQEWFKMFGREFKVMLLMRRIFESLSNDQIDQIFKILDQSIINEIVLKSEFDYHSSTLVRALGMERVLKILSTIGMRGLKDIISLLKSCIGEA